MFGYIFRMFVFYFVNYVFLLLYLYILIVVFLFRSVYSVSLCCSVYCLCVNVYCTVLLPPCVNPIAVNRYINILSITSNDTRKLLQSEWLSTRHLRDISSRPKQLYSRYKNRFVRKTTLRNIYLNIDIGAKQVGIYIRCH
jgi:hypothetical protein